MSMVMSSSGSGPAATGVGVGGRQPVSSDRLNIAAAAVAKRDGRRCTEVPIAHATRMYEDTAILRKDGTPIYGRKASRGNEKLSSTYVLYAVKVLLVMMSSYCLPGSERTSSSGCKASAGKRFSLI